MTEEQVVEYLKNRGCPEYVWKGGTAGLILSWRAAVAEVENGYDPRCLLEEYWNDLSARELIHDIGHDADVKELDERFRSMLTATHIKHSHVERKSDYDFWSYGYPRNASGFFLDEIRRRVLLDV